MTCDARRTPLTGLRHGYKLTKQLLLKAQLDTDPVSVFVDGCSWDDADAAIFVVKSDRAREVYQLLADKGLVTPGKPVVR